MCWWNECFKLLFECFNKIKQHFFVWWPFFLSFCCLCACVELHSIHSLPHLSFLLNSFQLAFFFVDVVVGWSYAAWSVILGSTFPFASGPLALRALFLDSWALALSFRHLSLSLALILSLSLSLIPRIPTERSLCRNVSFRTCSSVDTLTSFECYPSFYPHTLPQTQ